MWPAYIVAPGSVMGGQSILGFKSPTIEHVRPKRTHMPADRDIHSSWSRTSEYLREARAHLSEAAEGVCADEIPEFGEFLKHNELELA
jgi:hypothetical protein